MLLTTEEYVITHNKSKSQVFKGVEEGTKFKLVFNLGEERHYHQQSESVEVWFEIPFTRSVFAHKTTLATIRKVLASNSVEYELANK